MAFKVPKTLYKILTKVNWEKSKKLGNLILSKDDTKFIHFSTKEQVSYVVHKHYKDTLCVVLPIDTTKLPDKFKLEYNSGKTDQFYHLYDDEIPLDAVIEH
jgi:uncharacterized protein (DUF952 family)